MNEKERRSKEAIQAALATCASEPFGQAGLKLLESSVRKIAVGSFSMRANASDSPASSEKTRHIAVSV